ncbi:MAG: hypothetical protein K0S29_549, partial [Gammaproteobacteria bacterium]|nr:hypothetical protein [Gammaproteobacteria bacterium]
GIPPAGASSLTLIAGYSDGHGSQLQRSFKINTVGTLLVNAPTQIDFTQGQALLVPIELSSPSETLTVSFTSDNLNNGRMQVNATQGVSINQQGNTLTVSGNTAAVTQCLQSLTFIPYEYFRGVVRFSCRARDGINSDSLFNIILNQLVDVSHDLGIGSALPSISTTPGKATSFQVIVSSDPTNSQANIYTYDADRLLLSVQILENNIAIDSSDWTISINQNSGRISITPPAALHGDYQVKLIAQAVDSENQPIANKTAELSTSLNVGNTIPVLSPDQISDKTFNIGRNNTATLPFAMDPDGDLISFSLYDSSTALPVSQEWLQVRPIQVAGAWQYSMSGIPPIDAPDSLTLQANYLDGNGGLVQRNFKLNIVSTLHVFPSSSDSMQQASTGNDTYLTPRQVSSLGNEPVTVKITYDQTLGNMVTRNISGVSSSLAQAGGFATWQVSGPKESVNQHLSMLQFLPATLVKGPGKVFYWTASNNVDRDTVFTTMINISPINLAPEVHDSIPPVSAVTEGQIAAVSLSRTYFADPDDSDNALRWSVTHEDGSELDPDWFLEPNSLKLTGPMHREQRLKVTVTDPGGLSASQTFVIPYKPIPPWYLTFDWQSFGGGMTAVPVAFLIVWVISSHIRKCITTNCKQNPVNAYQAVIDAARKPYEEVKAHLAPATSEASESQAAPSALEKSISLFKKSAHVGEDISRPPKEVSLENLQAILSRITTHFERGYPTTGSTLQLIESLKVHIIVYACSTESISSAYLELEAQARILKYAEHVSVRLAKKQNYEISTYAKLRLIRILADLILLTETANNAKIPYEAKIAAYNKLSEVPDFKLDERKIRAEDPIEQGKAAIKFELKSAMAALAAAPDQDSFLRAIIKKRATPVPTLWYINIVRAESLAPFARYNLAALEEIISIHQKSKLEHWHVRYAVKDVLKVIAKLGNTNLIQNRAQTYLNSLTTVKKEPSQFRALSASAKKRHKSIMFDGLGANGVVGGDAFANTNPMRRAHSVSSTSNSSSPGGPEVSTPLKPTAPPGASVRKLKLPDVGEAKASAGGTGLATVNPVFLATAMAAGAVANQGQGESMAFAPRFSRVSAIAKGPSAQLPQGGFTSTLSAVADTFFAGSGSCETGSGSCEVGDD